MIKHSIFAASLCVLLTNCTTQIQTDPARTATEQLLISSAADRAAAKLALDIPQNAHVFIDSGNFEGTDSKYAIASIRSHLLQQGLRVVDDRKKADIIVETRAGALSTDRTTYIIGIPGFNVPIPLTSGTLPFPEIALYGREEDNGVAKFAVTGYDAKNGTLIASQEPQLGFAHNTKKTILLFFSSTQKDFLPEGVDEGEPGHTSDSHSTKSSFGINGNGYSSPASSTKSSAAAPAAGTSDAGASSAAPFKIPGIGR